MCSIPAFHLLHVCSCRAAVCNDASRHFSLKQLLESFFTLREPPACRLFRPRRASLQPPIRQYRILERPPTKYPLSEFIPRRGKTNGRYRARPTATKYVSRSPRIEIPGLVNQRGIRAADIYFEQLVSIGGANSFDLSVRH